jgi:MSHA biogenesis protein MshP
MKFRELIMAGGGLFKSAGQRGFALVSAIFLLVVLAALGVAIVSFSTAQQTSSALDVMGARAYQAARAGIEWALYQRLNPQVSNPGVSPAYCNIAAPPTSSSFAMPIGTTLSPFTVTVLCSVYQNTGTPTPIVIRTITATACNQPAAGACPGVSARDYVQRQVQISTQEPY